MQKPERRPAGNEVAERDSGLKGEGRPKGVIRSKKNEKL